MSPDMISLSFHISVKRLIFCSSCSSQLPTLLHFSFTIIYSTSHQNHIPLILSKPNICQPYFTSIPPAPKPTKQSQLLFRSSCFSRVNITSLPLHFKTKFFCSSCCSCVTIISFTIFRSSCCSRVPSLRTNRAAGEERRDPLIRQK